MEIEQCHIDGRLPGMLQCLLAAGHLRHDHAEALEPADERPA